jgi:transcriptional regulator with XRE-family HTH domain
MNAKTPTQDSEQCTLPVRLPIGPRLRQLREERGLSQGDIEERVGLLRCYISRVENGYKSPSLKTLEKFAVALGVPLYKLFYDGEAPPSPLRIASDRALKDPGDLDTAAKPSSHSRFLQELSSLWDRIGDFEQKILLNMATQLATTHPRRGGRERLPDARAGDDSTEKMRPDTPRSKVDHARTNNYGFKPTN